MNSEKFSSFSSRGVVEVRKMGDMWCSKEVVSEDDLIEYGIGLQSKAILRIGQAKFLDINGSTSMVVKGRPFAMIEGPDERRIILKSPVTGDVKVVNNFLKENPATLDTLADDINEGWLIKVFSLLDIDEYDEEWESMKDTNE